MTAVESLLDRAALRKYERDGVDALGTSERLLLRLRWFDWVCGDDLYNAMGCHSPTDRNRHASALLRLRKLGRVQVRGEGWTREYRLAPKRRRRKR